MDEQNRYPDDSGDQSQDHTPHQASSEPYAEPTAGPAPEPSSGPPASDPGPVSPSYGAASDDTSPERDRCVRRAHPPAAAVPAVRRRTRTRLLSRGPSPVRSRGRSASTPRPWQSSYPPAQPTRTKGRGLTAAVLVGALVLGGAAGVGGSALYDAFHDDGGTSSTGSAGDFQATKTATVQDGTVEKVANAVLPSVVKVNVTGSSGAGSGSGIVLSKDGNILTNNHVVSAVGDNGSISVNFNDGTTKKATVVGTDPVTDLAVIKVDDVDGLTPATISGSGSLQVGQAVVAVGSPYGLNATVTSGIVSALNRPVSVQTSEEQQQSPTNPFGFGQGQQQQQQSSTDGSTTYPAIQTDAAITPATGVGPAGRHQRSGGRHQFLDPHRRAPPDSAAARAARSASASRSRSTRCSRSSTRSPRARSRPTPARRLGLRRQSATA